jgi:hypothetical protein
MAPAEGVRSDSVLKEALPEGFYQICLRQMDRALA